MYNHNGQFVNDSHSRAGNLCHNHVSEDMFAAAEMAHLAFVLNVVLNGKHESSAPLPAISTRRTSRLRVREEPCRR